MEDPDSEHTRRREEQSDVRASKFRFKKASRSSRRRSGRHPDSDDPDTAEPHRSKRHRAYEPPESCDHHHDSKRRRKHKSSRTVHDWTYHTRSDECPDDNRKRESLYDPLNDEEQNTSAGSNFDPDAAFRESLFDALADDEGAAYWEGVYGQPVHTYSQHKSGPKGELERMSDQEYAEYVRTKMWEKTHQHVMEERKAREEGKKRQKQRQTELEEEIRQQEKERDSIRREMEASLRRGEDRRKLKELESAWAAYSAKWERLRQFSDLTQITSEKIRDLIPWPVASGRGEDVSKERIEYFFEKSKAWEADSIALLKAERVRWHPDKMQQRFGQHIEPKTMACVTAVFQVVDRLWNQRRK